MDSAGKEGLKRCGERIKQKEQADLAAEIEKLLAKLVPAIRI